MEIVLKKEPLIKVLFYCYFLSQKSIINNSFKPKGGFVDEPLKMELGIWV